MKPSTLILAGVAALAVTSAGAGVISKKDVDRVIELTKQGYR